VQFRYTWDEEAVKHIDAKALECKVYDYSDKEMRRRYILNSNILNESCTTKFYKRDVINRAGVLYAEGVSYEEPLFTYPLKFYVDRVAVTETPFYYYRYNASGTTAEHMNRINTLSEHLYVQMETHYFMMQTEYFKEYREEIELYFLHTFFVEVFYFSKNRGFSLPANLFKYMCEGIIKVVPDYMNNKYLNDSSMLEEKKILGLIQELRGLEDKDLEKKLCEVCKGLE